MTNHDTVEVDPKDLENAEKIWHNFTVAGKYSIMTLALLLIGLALTYVKFV